MRVIGFCVGVFLFPLLVILLQCADRSATFTVRTAMIRMAAKGAQSGGAPPLLATGGPNSGVKAAAGAQPGTAPPLLVAGGLNSGGEAAAGALIGIAPPLLVAGGLLPNVNPIPSVELPGHSGGQCKGHPSKQQQLQGNILSIICGNIGHPGNNFLVFGTGRDSPFWFDNTGGKIAFLENHQDWVKFQSEAVRSRTEIVEYTTDIKNYKTILQDRKKLSELLESLPQHIRSTRWDVILVDSPMGHMGHGVPGRMQSMYAARELAHAGTVIFVDDYQRGVERESATALLEPYSEKPEVFSNGHEAGKGRIAMFRMAATDAQFGGEPRLLSA